LISKDIFKTLELSEDNNGVKRINIAFDMSKVTDELEVNPADLEPVLIKLSVPFENGCADYSFEVNTIIQTIAQKELDVDPQADISSPILESITTCEDKLLIKKGRTMVLEIDTSDQFLSNLQIVHNLAGLPDLTLYASAENPYNSLEVKETFDDLGITIQFFESSQKWMIDFGQDITASIIENKGITLYIAVIDYSGNQFGYLDEITTENTFEYLVENYIDVTNETELQNALVDQYITSINLKNDITINSPITLNHPLSINGGNYVLSLNTDISSELNKHLIQIISDDVSINDLIINSNKLSFGVNVYQSLNVIFNNTSIKNSVGAGLTVNGSNVTANNLNTNNNNWGSVNVDPGINVTTPSVFTLSGNSVLSEKIQIYSDQKNITDEATVSVNAIYYNQYTLNHSNIEIIIWTNKEIRNVAYLESNTSKLYVLLEDALQDAIELDTVIIAGEIGSGANYKIYTIDKDITIRGLEENKVFGSFMIVSDGVTIDNVRIENKGDFPNHLTLYRAAITAYVNDITIINNTFMHGLDENGSSTGILLFRKSAVVNTSKDDYNITNNIFIDNELISANKNTSGIIIGSLFSTLFNGTTENIAVDDYKIASENEFINISLDYIHEDHSDTVNGTTIFSLVSNIDQFANQILKSKDQATICIKGTIGEDKEESRYNVSNLTIKGIDTNGTKAKIYGILYGVNITTENLIIIN